MSECLICKKRIGTGCNCCSDDFPENYGYCRECYPNSPNFNNNFQLLNLLMDHLDDSGLKALKEYIIYHHND